MIERGNLPYRNDPSPPPPPQPSPSRQQAMENGRIRYFGSRETSSTYAMNVSCMLMILSLVVFSSHAFSSPATPLPRRDTKAIEDEYDVVVIGSGVGGLSSAAMLSFYGYSVCVLESHSTPGGCAHGFSVKKKGVGEFSFDTGPSFFSGLNADIPAKSSNPLRAVLDVINEQVPCIPYSTFGLVFPEGNFVHTPNFAAEVIQRVSGSDALVQWKKLMKKMEPLERAVSALPTVALRFDIGAVLTAGPFLPNFGKSNPLQNLKLTKPFGSIVDDAGVTDTFTRNWLDLLCFCLSGLPAAGTITAEMAMMMGEFYEQDALMDCPKGGAKAITEALVRGIKRQGGQVVCNSHVDEVIVQRGRATGVRLRKNSRTIAARKAVISNLSVWDLFDSGIVNQKHLDASYMNEKLDTPLGNSFMHLHIGFKASREELQKLQAHYMYIEDWSRGVESEDNAALVSIPSVHDESLAPDGFAVLHIYTPATENFSKWENLDRKSKEYEILKEERSAFLWKVADKIIPDIRQVATVVRVGTPLTHKRFLRRFKGTYGPAIRAGEGSFPFPNTPITSLLVCGDSCFPGIGIPAVAGSGILAANSVSLRSLGKQLKILNDL